MSLYAEILEVLRSNYRSIEMARRNLHALSPALSPDEADSIRAACTNLSDAKLLLEAAMEEIEAKERA